MSNPKRPYRGMRGDYVLEQEYNGVWIVASGGSEDRCKQDARRYTNGLALGRGLRITPNRPGDPVAEGSYRPA